MKSVVAAGLVWWVGWNAAMAQQIQLTPILTDNTFEHPLALVTSPDGTRRQFLVEQTGVIRIVTADHGPLPVFLDIRERDMIQNEFEEGLLGLAFHPDYASNRKFYITYTQQGPKRTVLSEFQASPDDPNKADVTSERILMEIQQPDWNHNSGNLQFGPQDGYLYITTGDGGLKDGAFSLAQKLTNWFGKVLRIDVNSRTGKRPYGIPADNPFIGVFQACPEIYAIGLRNPWGIHMDPKTGLFWLADVGQNLWEEVNLIEKGANYGWEYREGLHRFHERDRVVEPLGYASKEPPANTVLTDPIWEYDRLQGLSIIGGYVYRGQKIGGMQGCFLVGDWKTGNCWALRYDPAQKKIVEAKEILRPALEANINPTAFAPDLDGEPIMITWLGKIYRMEPVTAATSSGN